MFIGKISAADIRSFLEFWPSFSSEAEELRAMIVQDQELLFGNTVDSISWCHLYELPAQEHFHSLLVSQEVNFGLGEIFTKFTQSNNQIAAIPNSCNEIDLHFESFPTLPKNEALVLLPLMLPMLANAISAYNSLVSLLYYGRFLNDLIDQVRNGDDKSLFNAISIDPTCIGCKPIISRISKAVLIQDVKFLSKVQATLGKKPENLEQGNFQKMRLVLEILHEFGASKLTDEELEKLFVEELNLYASNAAGGGSHDALRKFANTYMKKKSRT